MTAISDLKGDVRRAGYDPKYLIVAGEFATRLVEVTFQRLGRVEVPTTYMGLTVVVMGFDLDDMRVCADAPDVWSTFHAQEPKDRRAVAIFDRLA